MHFALPTSRKTLTVSAGLIALPILFSACSSSDSDSNDTISTDTDNSVAIAIPFEAMSNDVAVDCDTPLTGLGTAGTDAALKDFRFYVYNLRLGTNQGRQLVLELEENSWQQDGLALVDFQNKGDFCDGEDKPTHKEISGTVNLETGESIDSVSFTIGIPEALNHQDQTAAESPLNITSLFWSWQTGYKFMRLDIAPVGGVTRPTDPAYNNSTWNIHLGSTNCTGEPQLGETVACTRNNRPQIALDNFDPATSTIVVDYSALIAAASVGQDEGGAPGCMSGATDPECPTVFANLGLDVVSGDVDITVNQTVFQLK